LAIPSSPSWDSHEGEDAEMSLVEHSPARDGRAVFTITEFCDSHRTSRSMLYKMWGEGAGPRIMRVGTKVLISAEAAADWRRAREAASESSKATT
jgi:hypothetical protein